MILNEFETFVEEAIAARKNVEPEFPPLGDFHSFNGFTMYGEPFKIAWEESKAKLTSNMDEQEVREVEQRANQAKIRFKNMRGRAKAVGLAIPYGGSGFTVSQSLGVTKDEGDKITDEFFFSFKQLRKHLMATLKKAQQERLVRNLFGRIRYLPNLVRPKWTGDKQSYKQAMRVYSKAERLVYNAPIQSAGADQLKTVMITASRYLEEGFMSRYHGNLVATYRPYTRIISIPSDEVTKEFKGFIESLPTGNCLVLVMKGEKVVYKYDRPVALNVGHIYEWGMEIIW